MRKRSVRKYNRAYIYLLQASDGATLYVGQSRRLIERLRQHIQKSAFSEEITKALAVEIPAGALYPAEAMAIERYKPKYNTDPGTSVRVEGLTLPDNFFEVDFDFPLYRIQLKKRRHNHGKVYAK